MLTGPLELKEGASIVSTTPSQPYVPTDIPNGAAIQAGVIRDITTTAGLAAVGIHKVRLFLRIVEVEKVVVG